MTTAAEANAIVVDRSETQASRQGPAENFTGSVRVDQQFQAVAPGRTSGGRVTFEPGARTAWHSHPLGQTLIVTSGRRPRAALGGSRRRDQAGRHRVDPGRARSTGTARRPRAAMSHIAIVEQLDGKSIDWMEKVTDEQYGAPVRARPSAQRRPPAAARRPTDAGPAAHRRLLAQAGRSSPTTCSSATCGRARSSPRVTAAS